MSPPPTCVLLTCHRGLLCGWTKLCHRAWALARHALYASVHAPHVVTASKYEVCHLPFSYRKHSPPLSHFNLNTNRIILHYPSLSREIKQTSSWFNICSYSFFASSSQNPYRKMSLISKVVGVPSWYKRHGDGDDDGADHGYDYAPAACIEADGDDDDDDDGDYDYAPAASLEGDDDDDDDDDCSYDYAPAA